jgi:predicted AAA+ superfamily ATPase
MVKRMLFDELKSHIPKKGISFIVSLRQAGKTTLMLLAQKPSGKER